MASTCGAPGSWQRRRAVVSCRGHANGTARSVARPALAKPLITTYGTSAHVPISSLTPDFSPAKERPPSLGGTMARGTMSPKRDVRPNLAMVSSLCILLVFCFAHLRFGRTPAPRCVPHKQGKACRGGPITSAVYALFTIVSQTLVPPGPDVGGLGFRFRELGQKHD